MQRHVRTFLCSTAALIALATAPALANPQGPQVVGGAATVQGQGTSTVTVSQSTDKAIVNWNTFNIGAGETTKFVQPNSSSITLNRVTGGLGPSKIFGMLTANGRIFLVNPDGILFGGGAVINTAGFLASTNDIKNDDFMAGRYVFGIPGRPDASIVNLGTITATNGGFAGLVAPGVRNSGTITANLGKVALAAGNGFTLDFYGDNLISLTVGDQVAATVKDVATGQPLDALVKNEGTLRANGGRVQLTAAAARQVVDAVINNTGVIEADTIGTQNGMIVLGAATDKTKPAGAPTQKVKVSGTLSAAGKNAGEKGGKVQITGEEIELTGAKIDASGMVAGGTVLVGGDISGGKQNAGQPLNTVAILEPHFVPTATGVVVDEYTTINASATDSGNGGKVVVWADQATTFHGTIYARGGTQVGNGGFVEVSGHQQLAFSGTVDVGAPNGNKGLLLLDPQNVTIGGVGSWVITVPALLAALVNGDVLITTDASLAGDGDITVAESFSWANASRLIMAAYRHIVINDGVTISNTCNTCNDKDLLALGAGITVNGTSWAGNGVGTIIFNGDGKIDFSQSTGSVGFGYNPPAGYANPLDAYFASHVLTNSSVNHQFDASMWVNTIQDLQDISQNLAGRYIIANTIDATGFAFTPIGTLANPFTGYLGGVGGAIQFIDLDSSPATITNLTINAGSYGVGLFGVIGLGATVENIGLLNANVVGTDSYQFVGAVAGVNYGTIKNVYMTGSVGNTIVSGTYHEGANGGLVGLNAGMLLQSFAMGSVQVNGPTSGYIDGGGLVGQNTGLISQSFSVGTVNGNNQSTSGSYLGGLVGWQIDNGATMQSYAITLVTSSSPYTIGGGLIGVADNDNIFQSYAAGPVSITGSPGTSSGGLTGNFVALESDVYVALASNALVNSVDLISANSYWDKDATGQPTSGAGIGLTTSELKTELPSGFDSSVWAISASMNSGYPYLQWQVQTPTPLTVLQPDSGTTQSPITQPEQPILPTNQQITSLTQPTFPTDPTNNNALTINQTAPEQQTSSTGSTSNRGTGGNADPITTGGVNGGTPLVRPPEPTIPSVPPVGETRFVSDQVLLRIEAGVSRQQVEEVAGRLGLTIVSVQDLESLGTRLYLFRIPAGGDVSKLIVVLEESGLNAKGQPNYVFKTGQMASVGGAVTESESSQYATKKLLLPAAHRISNGDNVLVAVIDSAIDTSHPELDGVIVDRFDATGSVNKPHVHGTGIAGAIAAHRRVMGVAPRAQLLAVTAFSPHSGSAEATSMQILKAIDWAVRRGAKVINMSFAGPPDPGIQRALNAAHAKGIVLIAAVGNAGPKSPPLYPAANRNVIGVTATDADDRLFPGSNRGRQVAVAAPGVDILLPAPDKKYQVTTGTSFSAALVSGVAALLLARDPSLKPQDIRRILMTTAKDLGPKGFDNDYGSGLVDTYKALVAPKQKAVDALSTSSIAKKRRKKR